MPSPIQTAAILTTTLLSTTGMAVETPDWTYSRPASEFLQMLPVAGGGILALGETTSPSFASNTDVLVTKMSNAGAVVWTRILAGSLNNADHFLGAVARPAGGVALLGYYRDIGGTYGTSRLTLTHLDSDSTVISSVDLPWTTRAGLSSPAVGTNFAMSSDGRAVICRSASNGSGAGVLSIAPDGSTEWTADLHQITNFGHLTAHDVLLDDAGRTMLCCTGSIGSNGTAAGMCVVALSPTGSVLWTQHFDAITSYGDIGGQVELDVDGNLVVCGNLLGGDLSDLSIHVAKINPAGTVLWTYNLLLDQTRLVITDMVISETGDIHIGSSLFGPSNSDGMHMLTLDSAGNELWASAFSEPAGVSSFTTYSVAISPTNEVYQVGSANFSTAPMAQAMANWNLDGSTDQLEFWSEGSTAHEQAYDILFSEAGDRFVCGRGDYVNGRYNGTILHFTNTTCTGDIDGDGTVAVSDLLALLAAFGSTDAASDLDGNGFVDVMDLLILIDNWNGCNG